MFVAEVHPIVHADVDNGGPFGGIDSQQFSYKLGCI